ncbi:MAG TPA: TonB-dependent receptor plug domain-containing protein, partial [Gemmatimonadaceae bacterium]|nr:TonB-dependent receptor plug domain-containing protein [Gemmatimonadaceae bacterium]
MSRFALTMIGLVAVGVTRAQTPPIHPAVETQGHADVLERRVTIRLNRVPLGAALDTIASRAHVHLQYSWSVVPVDQSVSLTADTITVREALALVLRGTGAEAIASSEATIMLVPRTQTSATTSVSDTTGAGEVVVQVLDSADRHPLKGVSVSLVGTKFHGISNDAGDVLMINIPAGRKVVAVRYLGYTPTERPVVVPDTGRVWVTVMLKMGMAHLQEIVTTATGAYRRYDIANDVTILNADSIVATQPITSVTDLLEGRVPNLSVQHTSGTPGDPSRIRIRGASSALLSNDPVLIVDGVRVYAAQSDSLSGNLATGLAASNFGLQFAAPSPLDQIDPHSIETLEVLSGPSAATMYGPDAANGVIVITTKKGRPGPARWDVSAYTGTAKSPGTFPTGYFRFGHNYSGGVGLCVLGDISCHADSLVKFQILNDPTYSVIRPGLTNGASLSVSGGSTPDKNGSFLTYSFTGSSDGQSGNIGLPQVEVGNFERLHDGQSPPQWMRHPDHFTDWAARGSLAAYIGTTLDLSYTSAIQHRQQQRSDLASQLGTIMTTYVDRTTHTYYQGGVGTWGVVPTLAPDFYQRITSDQTSYLNSLTAVWHPTSWLQGTLTGGINDLTSQDDALEPANMLPFPNNVGAANTAHGATTEKTVTAGVTARSHLWWKFRGDLGVGVNYVSQSTNATAIGVVGLAPNATSIVGAQSITTATEAGQSLSSFGWYVAPNLWLGDIDLSPGFRLDNSSAFGQNARTPLYPKIGLSVPIAQNRWFPFKRVFDDLRLRFAWGRAGVWPSPQMKLRLYEALNPTLGGNAESATILNQLGNTQLRPERSDEIEGGFDAQFFNNLIALN